MKSKKPKRPQFQESDFRGADPSRIPELTESLNVLQDTLDSARQALDKLPAAPAQASTEGDAASPAQKRENADPPGPG